MKTGTIATTVTGISNSGIGIMRVSREQAFFVINSIFRSRKGERVRLNLSQSHTVHYEYIYDGDEKVDEAPVIIMKGSHSHMVEDTMGVDHHGGVLMVRRILETVLHAEVRTAESREFTKRAFLNGRLDLSQAEAAASVTHATNEYALEGSVSQLNGSVFVRIKELRSWILHQIVLIGSALDDPEHVSLDGYGSRLMDDLILMIGEVRKLLLFVDDGRAMSEGAKIVILGRPNAGKSFLMNVLLGEERAIATEIAGTTRGTLGEHIYSQGVGSNVVDTAGIRDTEDVVEEIGMGRVMKTTRDADLIIYVVDGPRPLDENDRKTIEFIRNRRTIVLLNKSDLDLEVGTAELGQICGHKVLPVSAKKEQRIELPEQEIKRLFYHGDLSFSDQIYIINARHKEALEQCLESLLMVKGSAGDGTPEDFYPINLVDACEQLGLIIGEAVDDDTVNEIFAKFCMGK